MAWVSELTEAEALEEQARVHAAPSPDAQKAHARERIRQQSN